MNDSCSSDQFEGYKCLMSLFFGLVQRFSSLFCALTGKCLSIPATLSDYCRISGEQLSQTGGKPVIG
jgi:hypothetical protein